MDFDVEMKTRDGVVLRADVVRPDISAKVPVILARTPYNKSVQFNSQIQNLFGFSDFLCIDPFILKAMPA